ncbi:MAG: hypothetical protein ABI411_16925 [Tahibacter sp.]
MNTNCKSLRRNRRLALAVALMGSAIHGQTFAAPVAVPNGDLSDPANNGSIGGGLLGGSGSGPLGIGPWDGSYSGIAGLLSPPLLTIGNGQATISGLALDALSVGNSGAFAQTLAATYVPSKHYVLAADLDEATTLLGANILSSGNAGLALSRGPVTLASTQGSPNVALSLGGSRKRHVALAYDSAPGAFGNIAISLYANPDGIAAAALVPTIGFSNIHLTLAPIPALPPAQVGPASGTPQAATVNTALSAPLVIAVTDAEGNPLDGVTVTFDSPPSGASVVLSSRSVVTDVGGRANVLGTANSIPGSYVVTASVDGVAYPAAFRLTNAPSGQPPVAAGTSGSQGQVAVSGSPFTCKLAVKVIVNDAPVSGATVVFSAPLSGPSASLSDGISSGAVLVKTTGADGVAAIAAFANSTPGSFSVTATATALSSGVLVPPVFLATYPLSNLDPSESVFASGFDVPPTLCGFNQ